MAKKIYLVEGEEGYATANNERMAHALVRFGQFIIVDRDEYQRVKAIVDAKSGVTEDED